jgi:hypothetical protein
MLTQLVNALSANPDLDKPKRILPYVFHLKPWERGSGSRELRYHSREPGTRSHDARKSRDREGPSKEQ